MIDHPVRLAVFDVDGTLISRAHPLGECQIAALRGLHAAGVTVALASSRQRSSLLDLAAIFGLPLYLISYNGPLIHAPDGTLISATDIDIPPELADALADFVAAGGCIHLYAQDDWHAYGPAWRIDNDAAGRGVTPSRRGPSVTPERLTGRQLKILCDGAGPALDAIRTCVADFPNLSMTWSGAQCHDIHAADATKGHALKRLAVHLDIDPAHTIAFGDADSDITMLQAAGTGFAMGEANARVIAAADQRLSAPGSGALENLLATVCAFDSAPEA